MNQAPHKNDRHLRVFISSTFRDMHAERDYLVKVIFPQLRRLCESRGVTWGEVDLRWGVTEEAAAEGKVLPICLEEINRCRPYFISLLGERYGWVPENIPDELLEREAWLQEQFQQQKSVTELEILHGVLRNPKMAGHAFFYFRDPAYLDNVPEKERHDYRSTDPDDEEKLRQLKESIRQSGFPLQENYPSPETLGDMVLNDLTEVINERWPEGSEPDPLTREALDHAAYARSRERVYIGRDDAFARLDAHASGTTDQPLVILGESGSGKSALLANWAARYRKEHPDTVVIEHYIGATPASADWASMLRRIMGELKQRFDIDQEIPDQPDALQSAFPNWLSMAAAKGKLILLLDALNQLEDRDGATDLLWLPPVMQENVRLFISTLAGRALDVIEERQWPTSTVEPLSVDERKTLIEEFLQDYGRSLSQKRVDRIANAPQSSNPLFLRVLLDELRLFGVHEELEERIAYYLEAGSPYDLYEKVIIRWEKDYEGDTDLVGDVLSLLWASRRGLSETELLDALGENDEPLPQAVWSPLFLAMDDALVSRGGLLTFAHDFLRTAARDAYIPKEDLQQQAHLRLADYFERQPSGPRRTDEFPWQLAEGKAWQRLYDLLTDRDFFNEAWKANQFEVKAYWTRIEKESSLRMVEAYKDEIDHPENEEDKNYLWWLGILLDDTGHPDEALHIGSTLADHFRETGDLNNLQASLGNQALILQARGELDRAMELHKEQEHICRQLGNLDGLSKSLGGQALILKDRGELDRAMELLKEVEHICRQLGNLNGLSTSLGNQGGILKDRGELDRAMELHKEQERICRQLGNPNGLSTSLSGQANIFYARGELDRAMELHKEQERICRQLGNLDGLQRSLGNQALILKDRGELDRAMELHKEEERICRQLGNLDGLQTNLGNQALTLADRGEIDWAMELYKEQEHICRQLGYLDGLQVNLGLQAIILQSQGKFVRAMTLYCEAEKICRKIENLDGLQIILCQQALLLVDQEEFHGAELLFKEQESICRQLNNLVSLQISIGSQALIWDTRGEFEKALEFYKEEEQICIQLDNLDALQKNLGNQALIFEKLEMYSKALELFRKKEQICRKLSNIEDFSSCLQNQALILRHLERYEEALEVHKKEIQTFQQLDDIKGLILSYANLAFTLIDMKKIKKGIVIAEEAFRLAIQHDYKDLASQIETILISLRQS